MTSAKLVIVWVLGAFFLLGGTWILNNLESTLGVSELSYLFAILIALVAFLITGLCWISVAAAHH